jgi:cytochrome P450
VIQTLSFLDTLVFNLLYTIPGYLQGLFTRNRFWVGLLSRLQIDGLAVRFVSRLRKKYNAKYFFTRAGGATALVVLDHSGIHHVLARSPELYGDSKSKHLGMSHFQPGAVTISRGDDWKDRRRFNEAVLDTGQPNHRYGDHFLKIIIQCVSAMHESAGSGLQWKHFDELFEQIACGVIFGLDPSAGRPLFDELTKMMRESNRVFGLGKSKYFDPFYTDIRTQLSPAAGENLVSLCPHIPSTDTTRVENQIPHWMFAIRETLAINTSRALALLISHPKEEQRAREELVWRENMSAEDIHQLKFLEGCVQEAMRLWPTTPFIAREAIGEEVVDGSAILPQTQILILNTFNHRDNEASVMADKFYPYQWMNGSPDLPFNHLSSGPQVCAGKNLALFIAKSVLAVLLHKGEYTLERPALDPREPLPAMYNFFRLSIRINN